jgi:hypothetical protein
MIATLLITSRFDTGPAIPLQAKGPITITVRGSLAVPVFIEARNHFGFHVAKVIKEAGSYVIERTGQLRASLAGNNPTRVVVTAEY